MKHVELVRVGDVEFLVEVADTRGGVQPVGAQAAFSMDGVRDTIEAVASQVADVWKKVKPDEASVEFGLKIAVKSGKLTGLLVEGAGEASLNITLTWRNAPAESEEVPGKALAAVTQIAPSAVAEVEPEEQEQEQVQETA